jgi:uncharacterized protein YbjT (DUF2867 family)
MKFTITGSLGNISKQLAARLIAAGHGLTVISSSPDRKAAIEAMGAKAAIGSVTDAAFLTEAFAGADAVYTMVSPGISTPEHRKERADIGHSFAAAIKAAGVKRVVNLSSIGAHLDGGTGPISGVHDVEQILNELDGVAIRHLRPGFFYFNFFANIPMIKNMGIIGSNYGAGDRLVMAHPQDIAAAAAEELEQGFSGKSYRYVVSDERSLSEVAKLLGAAIGKPDLPWVEFTDQQAIEGMVQAGLPLFAAETYAEMGSAVRSGILWTDYDSRKPVALGNTKLEDFAKEFAVVYGQ